MLYKFIDLLFPSQSCLPFFLHLFLKQFYFILKIKFVMCIGDDFLFVFGILKFLLDGSADGSFQIPPQFADLVLFGEYDTLLLFFSFLFSQDGLYGRMLTDSR